MTLTKRIEMLNARISFMENALCPDSHEYVPGGIYTTILDEGYGPPWHGALIQHHRLHECSRCKRLEYKKCDSRPGWAQNSGEYYTPPPKNRKIK